MMKVNAVIVLATLSTLLIQNSRCHEPYGGETEIHPSESEKNTLINYSLEAFNKISNSTYLYKVVQIHKITSQIVAGDIIRLYLDLGETICKKGGFIGDCPFKDPSGSVFITCKIAVYERPWEHYTDTTVESCVG